MSPWASPIAVVKMHIPEGSPQQYQLCVDYRKLNSLLPTITPTLGNKKGPLRHMPLPKIDELFAFLKGAKFFKALDLQRGYYHINLDDEYIPKVHLQLYLENLSFLDYFVYCLKDQTLSSGSSMTFSD